VNSALSPGSVGGNVLLNFCSTATLLCSAVNVSPALRRRRPVYAAILHRPLYESSFWISKEMRETSRNRLDRARGKWRSHRHATDRCNNSLTALPATDA